MAAETSTRLRVLSRPKVEIVNELITLNVYPYRADAELAVARLSADGIKAVVRDDNEGGLNPGFFKQYGVRIEVAVEDVDDAFESLGIERVLVPRQVADAMFAHAAWAYPNEACGLLAVDAEGAPVMVFCLTNTAGSRDRFTIDPGEHFGCVRFADERGWSIGGVFHSHTSSDAYPSETDVEEGGDPNWIHYIVGPVTGPRPMLRAFALEDGHVAEVSITVEP